MVRTRRSTRARRKKNSTPQVKNVTNSKKTQNSKEKTPKSKRKTAKTPPKYLSPSTSSSDISPLRGFEYLVDEEVEEPKLYGSFLNDDDDVPLPQAKDDLFDRLVDEDLPRNLHRNIRTYSNRRKEKPFRENTILEFQDCKNRDEILKWLNDNRNVFDRLTQTQTECVDNPVTDTQVTLDLPSVSQQNTPKVNRRNRETKKTRRSPYKLRARSLDIHIKKNLPIGRNRSHSLAGDTPALENYHIEEVVTDEDVPVPAEKDMIIVDLMEDEYLDNIEREIMQNVDKKNQSGSGWDRIKDINRTLNNTKKQPKQLKIVLQPNENKKGANLPDNDEPCYDFDVLENYFKEKMEKLLQDEKNRSDRSNISKSSNSGRFTVKNAVQVGKNFLICMRKVVQREGEKCLSEFQPLISELKEIFNVSVKENGTQTRSIQNLDKNIQTERHTVNVITQTERNLIHTSVQTDDGLKTIEKNDRVDVEVQTEKIEDLKKLIKQTSTATSATPDIFEDDRERQELQEAFNEDFQNEDDVEEESEVFDDDLNFDFNTEELLKSEPKLVKNENTEKPKTENALKSVKDEKENNEIERPITGDSVLVVSAESRAGNKGVKRQSESPVDSEEFSSKRPCAKFIREDLSVAFSTCVEDDDPNDRKETTKVIQLSEESDDINYDEYITNILKQYESGTDENTKVDVPPKTRTQEQIEELENIIHNATKPPHPVEVERNKSHESPSKLEVDLDYFRPASYVSDAEKTPKKSRRNLFESRKDKDVFSESLFDDRNITVLANRTITEHNVNVVIKECKKPSDVFDSAVNKVRDISKDEKVKVNILDNVILREGGNSNANNDGYLTQISDIFSDDVDVVESTPQKKRFPSVSDQREESALDVTLPPPLEFQDSEKPDLEHNTSKVLEMQRITSPPRRPLATINKVTSTPISQKPDTENFLSLSPISYHGKKPKPSPREESSLKKTVTNRENSRSPFDFAQQQLSKFSPLTIVRKPVSQESCRLNTTPKQKSILNYVRPSQENQESQKSDSFDSSGKRKPCIACSRVSRDQVIAISTLTNKKLATYSTSFSPKVTHLIVSTNERNCLKDHTIKFVSAVAAGIWVLNVDWVQQCLLKNTLVPEEPFEVLDVSGLPGPRQARLTRKTNPLFKGYKIHAAAPFASTTQQEVENVVKMLGGKVVPSPEHLLDKNGYICVIVTEARATQDFELYETWLEALKVVTVDIEWLSRSVGQYKLLSLRPFTLCSDDGIENLGYPPELTANMTYSFSQQTFSSVPSST